MYLDHNSYYVKEARRLRAQKMASYFKKLINLFKQSGEN